MPVGALVVLDTCVIGSDRRRTSRNMFFAFARRYFEKQLRGALRMCKAIDLHYEEMSNKI
jgi:hypothetical protein